VNLETSRPRGRPRNSWQDEVREDGRIVGGEEWQGKVYNREEWKKLLRTVRSRRILHMAMEWNYCYYYLITSRLIDISVLFRMKQSSIFQMCGMCWAYSRQA
jgi:hypothetical protein